MTQSFRCSSEYFSGTFPLTLFLLVACSFDVDVPGGPVLMESRSTAPGSSVVAVDSPVGRLGVTVCYDLRFPELYQRLRFEHGCEVGLPPLEGRIRAEAVPLCTTWE